MSYTLWALILSHCDSAFKSSDSWTTHQITPPPPPPQSAQVHLYLQSCVTADHCLRGWIKGWRYSQTPSVLSAVRVHATCRVSMMTCTVRRSAFCRNTVMTTPISRSRLITIFLYSVISPCCPKRAISVGERERTDEQDALKRRATRSAGVSFLNHVRCLKLYLLVLPHMTHKGHFISHHYCSSYKNSWIHVLVRGKAPMLCHLKGRLQRL